MASYRYAQINLETKVCFAVSNLPEMVNGDDMILLENGENPLGWTYDNGTWIEPEPEEPEEVQATNNELLENQYVMMMAIADLYEMNAINE